MYQKRTVISAIALIYTLCQANIICYGAILKESKSRNASQACICTRNHDCPGESIVILPEISQICGEYEVCCKNETVSDIAIKSSTKKLLKRTTATGFDKSCACVLPSRCQKTENQKNEHTALSSNGKYTCSLEQVCCPVERVINATETNQQKKPTSSDLRAPELGSEFSRCGERRGKIDIRIVGSDINSETTFGEFPWTVAIMKNDTDSNGNHTFIFVCGGSILSANHVLTAAHCVHNLTMISLLVRAGDYDTRSINGTDEPEPYQDRAVAAVMKHPSFHPSVLFNDLAILIISKPFDFAFHVAPICSPMYDPDFIFGTDFYDSSNCIATGWGKIGSELDAPYSPILKKVDLTLVPADECQKKLRNTRLGSYFILSPSFICAGGSDGLDTCKGDGGGPLICPLKSDSNRYMQVGVVSWGVGCATDVPGVYASLAANADWLFSQVNDNNTIFSSDISNKNRIPK